MSTIIKQKTAQIFVCEVCDFSSSRKNNYDSHIATSKHKKRVNFNILSTDSSKNQQENSFTCQTCNKIFKERTGLWRHKQKCTSIVCHDDLDCSKKSDNDEKDICDKELILTLLKQNAELLEIVKTNNL